MLVTFSVLSGSHTDLILFDINAALSITRGKSVVSGKFSDSIAPSPKAFCAIIFIVDGKVTFFRFAFLAKACRAR